MVLNEDDAAAVNRSILDRLSKLDAHELLNGIDESRRLGIEEIVSEEEIRPERKKGTVHLKQVARTRKRPPSNQELLGIILRLLAERLITLPSLRSGISKRLGTENVLWRVDTEFVTQERIPEVHLKAIVPEGSDVVKSRWDELQILLSNGKSPEEAG